MEKMMHLAAQYLAAAGISFLPKKEDDSHTNLGFDTVSGKLYTRPLNKNGDALGLNYMTFSLEWLHLGKARESFPLDGKSHSEILAWLKNSSKKVAEEISYQYQFHYKLPDAISDSFVFTEGDKNERKRLIGLRTLAQHSLQSFLETLGLESEIRVWPHHFDTGAFVTLDKSTGLAMGLGMAIPDTISDNHYIYIAGYKNGTPISPQGFKKLSLGRWANKDFKGAILPLQDEDIATVEKFLKEAYFSLIS